MDTWLPGEVPAWLEQARRANGYYEFMGDRHTVQTNLTQHWSPELKRSYWSDIITMEAKRLDLLPEVHSWHDPDSDRLGIIVDRLASRSYEEAFLEEMVRCLEDGAHGLIGEHLLGRPWQHWVRFLKYNPRPLEHREAPPGKLLTREEFAFLISSCRHEGSARAIRDGAMFVLAYGSAASTCEIATLQLQDYSPETPFLHVGRDLGPFKDRVVSLGPEAANLLTGWVALRGRKLGSLFYSLDKFGGVRSEQITGATLHAALGDRCKKAGLSPIVPEDLRRTGLTRLFEHGADLYAVADIAGHRTLDDTERYEPCPSMHCAPTKSHGETQFLKW